MKKSIKKILSFLTAMTVVTGTMGTVSFAEEAAVDDSAAVTASEDTELEETLEKRGSEMEQYLMVNGVDSEVAKEITGYYVQGLRERIIDGKDNDKAEKYYCDACLRIARLQMALVKTEGGDEELNDEVSQFLSDNGIVGIDNRRLAEDYLDGMKKIIARSELSFSDESTEPLPPANITPYYPQYTIYSENNGEIREGVEYHYDPETNGIFIDGDGYFTTLDGLEMGYNFHPRYYILGKDIKIDTTYKADYEGVNWFIEGLLLHELKDIYAYRGSDTEAMYNTVIDNAIENAEWIYVDGLEHPCTDRDILEKVYVINYLDDSVDPYSVLDGTAGITPKDKYLRNKNVINELKGNEATQPSTDVTASIESDSSQDKVSIKEDIRAETAAAEATLKGDADLNGEVGIADVIKVSKYSLSNALFPLTDSTAMANADMNDDGAVDSVDCNILIEANLGN